MRRKINVETNEALLQKIREQITNNYSLFNVYRLCDNAAIIFLLHWVRFRVKKTLYDLLELSKTASPEAILSSYQRLSAKIVDTDPDATNARIVLNEAFSTLSEPARRLRYDKTLADADASSGTVIYDDGGSSPIKKLLFAGLLIGVCGFGYNKYSKDKEAAFIEEERALAAEVLAASQRAEQAELQAELRAAKESRLEQQRQERQQQYEIEAARRQGAQITQANANAEERVRRESESQARQEENVRRQQQSEAQSRLAKDKAYLRQLESENSRYRRF
jgi:curved DNA-binding protein CbpA